jgi:hypothetical protein
VNDELPLDLALPAADMAHRSRAAILHEPGELALHRVPLGLRPFANSVIRKTRTSGPL